MNTHQMLKIWCPSQIIVTNAMTDFLFFPSYENGRWQCHWIKSIRRQNCHLSGHLIEACCTLTTIDFFPEIEMMLEPGAGEGKLELITPQTSWLHILMKILPNQHHLNKTMKESSVLVKHWDPVCGIGIALHVLLHVLFEGSWYLCILTNNICWVFF